MILRFVGIVFLCSFSNKKYYSPSSMSVYPQIVREAVTFIVSLLDIALLNCINHTFQLEADFLLAWSFTSKIVTLVCFKWTWQFSSQLGPVHLNAK